MSKDWKEKNGLTPRFKTNSTADRLGRLSVPKARRYMQLREEGKTIEEALNVVAPIETKEQLVFNTNPEEDE